MKLGQNNNNIAKFTCPKCDKEFAIDESNIADGDTYSAKCPHCDHRFYRQKYSKAIADEQLNGRPEKAKTPARVKAARIMVGYSFVMGTFIMNGQPLRDALPPGCFLPLIIFCVITGITSGLLGAFVAYYCKADGLLKDDLLFIGGMAMAVALFLLSVMFLWLRDATSGLSGLG